LSEKTPQLTKRRCDFQIDDKMKTVILKQFYNRKQAENNVTIKYP